MSVKPDIFPHGNTRLELAKESKLLREVADDIDAGIVVAAAWVTIERKDEGGNGWASNCFKARGVSSLELQGAFYQAMHELATEWTDE